MSANMYSEQFQDTLQYWMTLYPEIKTAEDFEQVIGDVGMTSLNDLHSRLHTPHPASENIPQFMQTFQSNLNQDWFIDEKFSHVPFYFFFKPVVKHHLDLFEEKLKNDPSISSLQTFIIRAASELFKTLHNLAIRTLILEVNIARLQNKLEGETSEARFLYFTGTLLKEPEFTGSLYEEYTVLTRMMDSASANYLNFVLEIAAHTEKDQLLLEEAFGLKDGIGKIDSIDNNLGDDHNGGQTVSIVRFTSGFKAVYKPRCVKIELAYQRFIDWLNEQKAGNMLALKTVLIMDRGEYGWMEFVPYEECTDTEGAERFYKRIGHQLAVFYILNANDFHHENLIASGEHPVPIDLESLFHSVIVDLPFASTSEVMAHEQLARSVYSAGLLPQKIVKRVDGKEISVDISGLGGEDEQASPFVSLTISGNLTDEIKIEKHAGTLDSEQNNPSLKGEVQRSELFSKEIKDGFTALYEWIAENKELVIAELSNRFAGNQSRYIARPTYVYSQLLSTALHPDFLRDELSREILLHRIGIHASRLKKPLLKAEIMDLMTGSIPYFTSRTDMNAIAWNGRIQMDEAFNRTPLMEAAHKIRSMGDPDLQRQLSIIDMSFKAKTSSAESEVTGIQFSFEPDKKEPEKWLELACRIGDHLLETSVADQEEGLDRTWISTMLEGKEEETWSIGPVGNDLYNGNSGIAVFLACLGEITGMEKYKKAAAQTIYSPIQEIKSLDFKHPYLVGAYNGLSGYLYAIYHTGKLLKDPEMKEFAIRHMNKLKSLASGDKVYDVVGGSAGSIGAILSLYKEELTPGDREVILDCAHTHFLHLRKNHQIFGSSIAWKSDVTNPGSGFSHGNAGIAAYLGKLYELTKDEEVLNTIQQALAYERELFSEEHGNWYSSPEKTRMSIGWCHGAPGILLSRLLLKRSGYTDDQIDSEIVTALSTTLSNGFGHNPSYCHGDLGNLSIVQLAAETFGDQQLQSQALSTFQQIFDQVLSKRWKEGVFRGTDSMSVMIGLTGFGYSLLKQYAPSIVPDILWFE
ncbi:type 2 lanthipeptide synthetase LanM family protein [Metabacillus sp. FJAT-52054]|uniref:Type 2 lanthipeptide synthetase LanM family protein n=1 Tax=Metabacillus sediminis TaxID=3117746 RepID=A0ABZ2NFH0_9BACI